ncbi:MAG: hypothetical protein KDC57_07610 [Saprospiraceae bacterium]|nr:hypothetical protein [Saprospiraceae bacterium]
MAIYKVSGWIRIILAVVVGEAILVVLTTLVQENLFGGISYTNSSRFDLVFGGAGTFLSAVICGAVSYFLVNARTTIPLWIISTLITAESIWLIFFKGTGDPVWFDLLASLSLLAGVWVGALLVRRFKDR